eukprot:TRINITY_DN10896_c0_g1_i1.p1 TRINITY_DN10896_c0_g1~~TRINITY_DN10896_c0_g1_i1.p1  ORF type:complete len:373 (-),score=30.35 TRINITY_DN10896_c0_g1_i1:134-1252(-)
MEKKLFACIMCLIYTTVNGDSKLTFKCESTRNCTSDVEHGQSRTHCQPDSIKKNSIKIPAIINIVIIIIIGGLGNLLTIISIVHARLRYTARFPTLWNSTTILMLHLSLCDFLYCTLGLPVFISVYYNGFLPHSEIFCRHSSMVRNWIAYADFLTMAAIAVTRSLGYILNHYNLEHISKIIFSPKLTSCACIVIWLLAFLILSPITFSLTIGKYYFGTFGYDVKHGKCEVLRCETSEGFYPGAFIFGIAFFVPFLFLLVSHIVIITVLELEKRRTGRQILAAQSQVPTGQIQVTLLVLSLAYFLFALPVLLIENTKGRTELNSLSAYSWYWWMYAINFILYLITLKDFRTIYCLFFNDVCELISQLLQTNGG